MTTPIIVPTPMSTAVPRELMLGAAYALGYCLVIAAGYYLIRAVERTAFQRGYRAAMDPPSGDVQ